MLVINIYPKQDAIQVNREHRHTISEMFIENYVRLRTQKPSEILCALCVGRGSEGMLGESIISYLQWRETTKSTRLARKKKRKKKCNIWIKLDARRRCSQLTDNKTTEEKQPFAFETLDECQPKIFAFSFHFVFIVSNRRQCLECSTVLASGFVVDVKTVDCHSINRITYEPSL